jgi:hypothetical protein
MGVAGEVVLQAGKSVDAGLRVKFYSVEAAAKYRVPKKYKNYSSKLFRYSLEE